MLICLPKWKAPGVVSTDFVVSGAGSSGVNGTYEQIGTVNGYPSYKKVGEEYYIDSDGTYFILYFYGGGNPRYYCCIGNGAGGPPSTDPADWSNSDLPGNGGSWIGSLPVPFDV